jgi:hypothetical protein
VDDNFRSDIYFLQNNEQSRRDALKLRDAVLSLRSAGAFVAVPLYRVNYGPIGPHTVGKIDNLVTIKIDYIVDRII